MDLVILKCLIRKLFSVLLFVTFRINGDNCTNNYTLVVRILTAFIHCNHNTQGKQVSWGASDASSVADILWRAEKVKNKQKKEVRGNHSNIKPDTSLKQVIDVPKDIVTPQPFTNLVTKSN